MKSRSFIFWEEKRGRANINKFSILFIFAMGERSARVYDVTKFLFSPFLSVNLFISLWISSLACAFSSSSFSLFAMWQLTFLKGKSSTRKKICVVIIYVTVSIEQQLCKQKLTLKIIKIIKTWRRKQIMKLHILIPTSKCLKFFLVFNRIHTMFIQCKSRRRKMRKIRSTHCAAHKILITWYIRGTGTCVWLKFWDSFVGIFPIFPNIPNWPFRFFFQTTLFCFDNYKICMPTTQRSFPIYKMQSPLAIIFHTFCNTLYSKRTLTNTNTKHHYVFKLRHLGLGLY